MSNTAFAYRHLYTSEKSEDICNSCTGLAPNARYLLVHLQIDLRVCVQHQLSEHPTVDREQLYLRQIAALAACLRNLER